jgi:hypothetical protein
MVTPHLIGQQNLLLGIRIPVALKNDTGKGHHSDNVLIAPVFMDISDDYYNYYITKKNLVL